MIKHIVFTLSFYYCYPDERHFFLWLEGIRGIKSVKGIHPSDLRVAVDVTEFDGDSFHDLIGLFSRYELDFKALRPLNTKKTRAYVESLKDRPYRKGSKKVSYYEKIFEDG